MSCFRLHDDRIAHAHRVAAVKDGATTLASYDYLGTGRVVRINYEQPRVRLDLWGAAHSASSLFQEKVIITMRPRPNIYVVDYNRRQPLAMLIFAQITIMMFLGCARANEEALKHVNIATVSVPSSKWEPVVHNGKLGYATPKGQTVITPQFENETYFINHRAGVKYKGLWFVIDDHGNVLSARGFASMGGFHDGYAPIGVKTPDGIKHGFINRNGDIAVEPKYDGAESFGNGIGLVFNYPGKSIFVSPTGTELHTYADAGPFREGLAPVEIKGLWGYINHQFNVTIRPSYDDASLFSDGMAAVVVNDKVGYVNQTGTMVIPPQYEAGYNFIDGYAAVETKQGWVLINKCGESATQPMSEAEMFEGTVSSQVEALGWIEERTSSDWAPLKAIKKTKGKKGSTQGVPAGE